MYPNIISQTSLVQFGRMSCYKGPYGLSHMSSVQLKDKIELK